MEFKFTTLDVDSFLAKELQPTVFIKDIDTSSSFWTLTDIAFETYSVTKVPSDAVRVPVFAVRAKVEEDVDQVSTVFMIAMEQAFKFVNALASDRNFRPANIKVVHLVCGKRFHIIGEDVRIYFGISLEMER